MTKESNRYLRMHHSGTLINGRTTAITLLPTFFEPQDFNELFDALNDRKKNGITSIIDVGREGDTVRTYSRRRIVTCH